MSVMGIVRGLGRFTTAVSLAAALLAAWGFGMEWIRPFIPTRKLGEQPLQVWEQPLIAADGAVFLRRRIDRDHNEHRTPAGDKLADQTKSCAKATFNPFLEGANLALGACLIAKDREFWYLMIQCNPTPTAFFVGYDAVSARCIGYIGRNGFQDRRPVTGETFTLNGASGSYVAEVDLSASNKYPSVRSPPDKRDKSTENLFIWLATPDGVLECELVSRQVREFAPLPTAVHLVVARPEPLDTNAPGSHGPVRQNSFLVARTKLGFHLYALNGKPLGRAALPAEEPWTAVTIFATASGEIVASRSDPPRPNVQQLENEFVWFRAGGDEIRRQIVSTRLIDTAEMQPIQEPVLSAEECMFPWVGGVSAVVLAAGDEWVGNLQKNAALASLWAVVCTAVVIACIRRQRLFAEPWPATLFWAIFAFALGLPGWIGFRFHRQWPQLLRCEACGHKRRCDRPRCTHCGQPLQKPETLGTEILLADAPKVLAHSA